jgi:hypothetical protein
MLAGGIASRNWIGRIVALAAALEKGVRATFKSPASANFEFPVQPGVIPWLRACARRNDIAIEPARQ